jgi:hypothetical protein
MEEDGNNTGNLNDFFHSTRQPMESSTPPVPAVPVPAVPATVVTSTACRTNDSQSTVSDTTTTTTTGISKNIIGTPIESTEDKSIGGKAAATNAKGMLYIPPVIPHVFSLLY